MFSEEPEAWLHGPVFPTLYQEYKTHGWHAVSKVSELFGVNFTNPDVTDSLNQMWEEYGKILYNGYNFPEKLIEEFHEDQYYEFSFNNGQRAIAIKYDFIIELLFLDPNHFIYSASSREYKQKLKL